jgi:hypothetical protein
MSTLQDKWQSSELELHLNEHNQNELFDAESVHLSNPEYRKKIDKIITHNIWSAIEKGVSDSTIAAILPQNDKDISDNIEEQWHTYTAKSFTFMLSDPERPIGTYRTMWFCRGKIRCSVVDYMISLDFYIHFPLTFNMEKILYLLKSPAFVGMPPILSYEEDIEDGEGMLILKFSKGTGAGGGLLSYAHMAEDEVFNEVQKNLNIIYALNTLEVDFNRDQSFDDLFNALVVAYESR